MYRSVAILGVLLVSASTTFAQQEAADTAHTSISNVTSTSAVEYQTSVRHWRSLVYTDLFTNIFQGNAAYVTLLTDHIGVGGGLHIPSLADERGIGITAEARFCTGKHALGGFYLSPNFTANLYKRKIDTTSKGADAFSAGLIAGYEWIWSSGFTAGVGLGMDFFSLQSTATYIARQSSGINPAFRFDLGWAW